MHSLNATLIRNAHVHFLLTPRTISALAHNVHNHLARLLASLARANNLNRLVLGLRAGNLDPRVGLLAQVVDGAAAGADNQSVL